MTEQTNIAHAGNGAPVAAAQRRVPAIPILAALAVAQLALIAWLFWPQPAQTAAGPLFPNLDPDAVNAITIVWDEQELHFARRGDGWVLPERGDFPVNALAVSELLTKVAQIDTSRLVASNAASHARLRVDDANPIRRVEMTSSDGGNLTLFVGTAPNARATNVRAGGSDNVYITSALSTGDVRTDVAAWVNTQYLNLDPASISQLTIENAAGTLALARGESGAWTLPDLATGESVITDGVETLARNLSTLGLSDVLGTTSQPEYGLDQPLATVTLDLTATAEITGTVAPTAPVQIVIGARDDASGSYAVKASTSPFYVRVTAATLEPIVNATRAGFVSAPPTPEGAVESATPENAPQP